MHVDNCYKNDLNYVYLTGLICIQSPVSIHTHLIFSLNYKRKVKSIFFCSSHDITTAHWQVSFTKVKELLRKRNFMVDKFLNSYKMKKLVNFLAFFCVSKNCCLVLDDTKSEHLPTSFQTKTSTCAPWLILSGNFQALRCSFNYS